MSKALHLNYKLILSLLVVAILALGLLFLITPQNTGAAECTTDAQCVSLYGEGYECQAGTCAPIPVPGGECTTNADCPGSDLILGTADDQQCVGGSCVDFPVPGGECTYDADCLQGKICDSGSCVDIPTTGGIGQAVIVAELLTLVDKENLVGTLGDLVEINLGFNRDWFWGPRTLTEISLNEIGTAMTDWRNLEWIFIFESRAKHGDWGVSDWKNFYLSLQQSGASISSMHIEWRTIEEYQADFVNNALDWDVDWFNAWTLQTTNLKYDQWNRWQTNFLPLIVMELRRDMAALASDVTAEAGDPFVVGDPVVKAFGVVTDSAAFAAADAAHDAAMENYYSAYNENHERYHKAHNDYATTLSEITTATPADIVAANADYDKAHRIKHEYSALGFWAYWTPYNNFTFALTGITNPDIFVPGVNGAAPTIVDTATSVVEGDLAQVNRENIPVALPDLEEISLKAFGVVTDSAAFAAADAAHDAAMENYYSAYNENHERYHKAHNDYATTLSEITTATPADIVAANADYDKAHRIKHEYSALGFWAYWTPYNNFTFALTGITNPDIFVPGVNGAAPTIVDTATSVGVGGFEPLTRGARRILIGAAERHAGEIARLVENKTFTSLADFDRRDAITGLLVWLGFGDWNLNDWFNQILGETVTEPDNALRNLTQLNRYMAYAFNTAPKDTEYFFINWLNAPIGYRWVVYNIDPDIQRFQTFSMAVGTSAAPAARIGGGDDKPTDDDDGDGLTKSGLSAQCQSTGQGLVNAYNAYTGGYITQSQLLYSINVDIDLSVCTVCSTEIINLEAVIAAGDENAVPGEAYDVLSCLYPNDFSPQ